jgi:predicted lipoprotein with Yx(FWY)xxD motif
MSTSHRTRSTRVAGVLLLALVSVGCGSGNGNGGTGPEEAPPTAPSSPSAPTEAPTSEAPTSAGTRITSATSDFGTVLWGPEQQVVYIWEKEPTRTATCYDDCAEVWPPVLTDGKPVAAGDVDPAKLGTTTRQDGSTQVTYNDHPLYYYAHEGPGEVKCHDVATHGGLWWVVTPAGERAP